ncbi:MAG: DNA methyltransferase [Nitrosotalea sp.]
MMLQQIRSQVNKKEERGKLVAESYTGMYSMHKYWSKKPANLIRNLIIQYSKKNEIVLDPFSGSGISVAESVKTDRKTIGIDINPAAIFITREILEKIEPSIILEEFEKIRNDCESRINELYKIKRKNRTLTGTHFLWSNGKLKEIWHLVEGKKRIVFKPTSSDIKLTKSFTYEKIPYYYPKNRLFSNSRINAQKNTRICDLFTPRNTLALSLLLKRIQSIKDPKLRELFKFCFSASLGQSSKMVFVINNRGTFSHKRQTNGKEVGSWVIGYWIPKENFEVNVWNCFSKRFRRILNSKKEQIKLSYQNRYVKNFKELKKGNLLLVNDSALRGLKTIPNNSIDYILTDPPHANRVPYLELSMMWNSWLRNKVNYIDEIVISGAKDRNKDIENYNLLLGRTLQEIQRVLKPNRYFTLIFNSKDKNTWDDLFRIIKASNLKIYKITTMGYSANSVIQDNRKGALKSDYVLTFKKSK